MHILLESHRDVIKDIFKKHKVIEAYVFGSILSDDFNENSDIDFLIKFEDDLEPLEQGDLWWNLHDSLRNLLKREVDLVTINSIKNPYFIKELNKTKQSIYG